MTRHLLLIAGLTLLPACDDGSVAATGHSLTFTSTTIVRPAGENGRIRYSESQQPMFVAPNGSRRPIASMLAVPEQMRFGDFVWRDLPAGSVEANAPVWIRVDLARQLLSVFRGGDEIGTTVIIYGTDGKDTPTGMFPVRGKERMHRSVAYDADMPFTLWLTGDGVAIHASSVERGRATHGCIGIPANFADKLFAVVKRGDLVAVLPARRSTKVGTPA